MSLCNSKATSPITNAVAVWVGGTHSLVRRDREIVRLAVTQTGYALEFACEDSCRLESTCCCLQRSVWKQSQRYLHTPITSKQDRIEEEGGGLRTAQMASTHKQLVGMGKKDSYGWC
eukprot:6468736-Amphidinium_carterae.2